MLYYLYKLYFDNFDECYIGITKDIETRLRLHKCSINSEAKKNMKLYKFINDNNLGDKIKCEVLKEMEVENIQEAKVEERKYIEVLNPYLNCVIPNRTHREYYNQFKKEIYRKRNIKNLSKREANRKKCLDHYYKNKEKRIEYMKKWTAENGAKYKEKRYRKIICLCGKELCYASLKKHIQTKEHQKNSLEKIGGSKQKLIYNPKNICVKI